MTADTAIAPTSARTASTANRFCRNHRGSAAGRCHRQNNPNADHDNEQPRKPIPTSPPDSPRPMPMVEMNHAPALTHAQPRSSAGDRTRAPGPTAPSGEGFCATKSTAALYRSLDALCWCVRGQPAGFGKLPDQSMKAERP